MIGLLRVPLKLDIFPNWQALFLSDYAMLAFENLLAKTVNVQWRGCFQKKVELRRN